MKVSIVDNWRVHQGLVVTEDGVTQVTVISDGHTEWATAENPVGLIAALMTHVGINKFVDDKSDN